MDATEATSNIIVAMINGKFLNSPNEIAEAYNTIYQAVMYPDKNK